MVRFGHVKKICIAIYSQKDVLSGHGLPALLSGKSHHYFIWV
jgi:hypothetical protein